MNPKEPHSAADILKSLIRTTPLGRILQQAQIWEHWPEIVGQELAGHGRPSELKKQQLRVAVESSVWMNRYGYCEWEIIQRINRMAGRELVSDLFFFLDAEKEDDE